ncbi:putative motility protein [Clostridium neonatale]|nr:YjfB family protein [Clostridium neonatale]MBS4782044.1 YjfB family protein [Clostridium sp.]PEG26644.1 putative motility protein [Clostridium neonatale]PEG32746.1 putative motility protein [Clostridium neonatale]
MSIADLSMGMSQASLQNAVSISVLNMTMDTAANQLTAMTEVLDNLAVDPNLGSNIDVTV